MSINPLTYEVVESEGVVNVVVTKTGNFQSPIEGILMTSTGTAGGEINASRRAKLLQPETHCVIVIAFMGSGNILCCSQSCPHPQHKWSSSVTNCQ